jgi:hypothetical protein
LFRGICSSNSIECRFELVIVMTAIDWKRLAAQVSAQHGIRIDPDDPMMAVMTMNRLVFEQAMDHVLGRVQATTREFEVATDRVQVRVGRVLAQEVRECGFAMRQEFAKAFEESRRGGLEHRSDSSNEALTSAAWSWLVTGLAVALALLGFGIWIGTRLR